MATASSSLFSKILGRGCGIFLLFSFDRVLPFVVVSFVGGGLQCMAGFLTRLNRGCGWCFEKADRRHRL